MMLAMRIPFVALGAFLILLGLALRRRNARAASWPSTEGEIIASSLVNDARDGDSHAEIRYRYVVDGDTFCCGQFSFAVSNSSPAMERGLVEAFPVGRKVDVRYDPADPGVAVLEVRPSAGWLALAAAGGVCIGLGLFAP